jgi:undecaprenol kinase
MKTFREEQNLRIQSFLGSAAVLAGWYFRLSRLEWAVLALTIVMVLATEIVNSAIERVTDVLKPRIDSYVKEIKDIMAAAVMLVSFFAVIIGIIIFWPHLF